MPSEFVNTLLASGPLGAIILAIGGYLYREVSSLRGEVKEVGRKQDRADKKIAVVIARLNWMSGSRERGEPIPDDGNGDTA